MSAADPTPPGQSKHDLRCSSLSESLSPGSSIICPSSSPWRHDGNDGNVARSVRRSVILSVSLVCALALTVTGVLWKTATVSGQAAATGQPSTAKGEWPHYTADIRGSRYSPLDQINGSNFSKLEVAWRFKTDSLGPFPEYKLEGTPLMVNGTLYTTGGTRRSVIALDPKTGELQWVYSLREGKRAALSPRQLSGRGVSYWTDGRGDERVVYVTTGYRLVELNAKTGQPVQSFAQNGVARSQAGRGVWHRPAGQSRER